MCTTSTTSPDAPASASGSIVAEPPELQEADGLLIPLDKDIKMDPLPDSCIPHRVSEMEVPTAEPKRGTEDAGGESEDLPPISPDKEARFSKNSSIPYKDIVLLVLVVFKA